MRLTNQQIMEQAQEAFWATVAKLCPNAKSGDFPPDHTAQFDVATVVAVTAWRQYNDPDACNYCGTTLDSDNSGDWCAVCQRSN